jgi:hypothetical protein
MTAKSDGFGVLKFVTKYQFWDSNFVTPPEVPETKTTCYFLMSIYSSPDFRCNNHGNICHVFYLLMGVFNSIFLNLKINFVTKIDQI